MRERHVALLIETSTSWGSDIVSGIANYARKHGDWYFHLEPRGKYERLALPEDWGGDGVIARVTSKDLAQELLKIDRPTVNVSWYAFEDLPFPTCTSDEVKAGCMIAEHFLDRGFQHFAYAGPMNRPLYTDVFGKAYDSALDERGIECARFENRPSSRVNWTARLKELGQWLVGLPKPVAVLAFSDIGGRQVAEACRLCGLRIPDEVAVIGGEHDALNCQITRPPLSSIDLCPERIGWEAAALLARLMDGQPPPEEPIRIPPARIIVRQSTDTLAVDDPVLVQALGFIAENATRAISVGDILESVPVSRRVLEQRFQKRLGRTPAAEIRRVRIEIAKRMLAGTDRSLNQIAAACGFDHPEVLTRVFRRYEGTTPSAYRRQIHGDQ